MSKMTDKLKNLKKHLTTQIKEANRVNSEWVYILKVEAETCLQLAEAEESIIELIKDKKTVKVTRKNNYWATCDGCGKTFRVFMMPAKKAKHCPECGREIIWDA